MEVCGPGVGRRLSVAAYVVSLQWVPRRRLVCGRVAPMSSVLSMVSGTGTLWIVVGAVGASFGTLALSMGIEGFRGFYSIPGALSGDYHLVTKR